MVPYVPCSDEEYFQRLVKEAPYVDGWHLNNETLDNIEWLDRDLLEKSKPFFDRHRHMLAASSGIVAAYGIGMKSVTIPFMYTGTLSTNADKTVRRTVKHIAHFVEWFHRGTLDDYVYKDVQKIKKMHNLLATTIKPYEPPADETVPDREQAEAFRSAVIQDIAEMGFENAFAEFNTYNPQVYLSQFDMVIIQLDFLAPFFATKYHLIEDVEGVHAIVHHWAVIGRLLGIEDRFNLALHPSKDLMFRILKNSITCSLTMDLPLARMMQAHLDGVTRYFHVPMSAAALFYAFTKDFFPEEFKGEHTYQLLSVTDKVWVMAFSLSVSAVSYVDILKSVARYVGVTWCAKTSTAYHKLLKEDKMKLPIESV